MIEALIYLVVTLAVAGIIWLIVKVILDMVPMPDPIRQIVNLLMILILVLVVVYYGLLPLLGALPVPRRG